MVLWRGSIATFPVAETRAAVAPDDWRWVLALVRTVPELNPDTNADGAADRTRRGRSIRGLRDETLEHEADGMAAAPPSDEERVPAVGAVVGAAVGARAPSRRPGAVR